MEKVWSEFLWTFSLACRAIFQYLHSPFLLAPRAWIFVGEEDRKKQDQCPRSIAEETVLYVFQVTPFILKGSNQEQSYLYSPFRDPLLGESETVGKTKKEAQDLSEKHVCVPSLLAELGSLNIPWTFLALQQGNKSVNTHHTCSYPQYLQGILLCNERGQRRSMYNENTLEMVANSIGSPMQGMCNKINILPFLPLLPSSRYVNSTALEVLE